MAWFQLNQTILRTMFDVFVTIELNKVNDMNARQLFITVKNQRLSLARRYVFLRKHAREFSGSDSLRNWYEGQAVATRQAWSGLRRISLSFSGNCYSAFSTKQGRAAA